MGLMLPELCSRKQGAGGGWRQLGGSPHLPLHPLSSIFLCLGRSQPALDPGTHQAEKTLATERLWAFHLAKVLAAGQWAVTGGALCQLWVRVLYALSSHATVTGDCSDGGSSSSLDP